MTLPKLNKSLLLRIVRHLEADVRRYDQSDWMNRGLDTTEKGIPPCGTQACIAGWAVLLKTPKKEWQTINCFDTPYTAQNLLGLMDDEKVLLFSI